MLIGALRQLRMIRRLNEAKVLARLAHLPPPTGEVLPCARCGVFSFAHTALYRTTPNPPAGLCEKYRMPYANVRWYEAHGARLGDLYFIGTTDHPIEFEGEDGEPFIPSFVGGKAA